MKTNDAKEKFKHEYEIFNKNGYVNPMEMFEQYYFHARSGNDYRHEAIARCIRERVESHTTGNTIYDAMKAYVKVVCPVCGQLLNGSKGGGTYNNHHIEYFCEQCEVKVVLTTPESGFEMRFKNR